ncbi:hypothetical protein F5Y05DRAFT_416370 [Hypoxylon sp. FL0543]|nr:hypothetical protein F5Y05DRAFT_416370 [Hypoxylon sp. FL0543]
MALQADQLEAAEALSKILRSNNTNHAIIGGFALRLLGHNRGTEDVDVEIDFATNTRDQVTQLLTQHDDRFTVQHRKLFFAPTNSSNKVCIETLPLGELGLPRQLRTFTLETCPYLITTMASTEVPILHPAVLILTKIKRCVQLATSTRPQSIVKFHNDCSDITFLLNWLAERDETIDFVGYNSAAVDRLYKAVADIIDYWRQAVKPDLVDLVSRVLERSDREKIMDG